MSSPLVEIVTTVATEDDAVRIARELVEAAPVACASFFPVRSVYTWKGATCDEVEHQIVCKTLEKHAEDVERRLAELHPYETPAILRVPVLHANAAFVAWVEESSGDGEAGGEPPAGSGGEE
jgi:periplasmic divalent cation tolerance protein